MNNYEKYFGNIDKAAKTIVNEGSCDWCPCVSERLATGKCDECCEYYAKEFLKKEVKTKKVKNCDLYKTPEELIAAYINYCESINKDCEKCKYASHNSLDCRTYFTYDYTEVEDD